MRDATVLNLNVSAIPCKIMQNHVLFDSEKERRKFVTVLPVDKKFCLYRGSYQPRSMSVLFLDRWKNIHLRVNSPFFFLSFLQLTKPQVLELWLDHSRVLSMTWLYVRN